MLSNGLSKNSRIYERAWTYLAGRTLAMQDAGNSRTGCLYNVLSVSNAPRQQTNSAEEGGKEKH